MAHAAHLWINQHLPKPFMRPLGYVRRGPKTNATAVSDILARRDVLFLCAGCEARMPWRWATRHAYHVLPGLHGDGVKCDGCQERGPANIYHAEEGGYFQQWQQLDTLSRHAAAQSRASDGGRVPIRDRRRVR